MKYNTPQLAIMRNGAGHYLEYLANITTTQEHDNRIRDADKLVTLISLVNDISRRDLTNLERRTKYGLDYLVEEIEEL